MRSILRLEKFEPIVRQLAVDTHPEAGTPIFPTMRELLCFAAVLGFDQGKRIPIGGSPKEIDGRIFENKDQAMDIIHLIALAEKKDADLLRDENIDDCLTCFEEYANGGLEIMGQWLGEHPEDDDGDCAIMFALRKHGYLNAPRPIEDAAEGVSFAD